MLPTTTSRVRQHTSALVNDRIRRETEQRLHYYAQHPEDIDVRILRLEREWDIERTLEANFAGVSTLGFVMALFGRRRWLLLSGLASVFMLQHSLQGWCPPLRLFRRLGLRTQSEIEFERYALKALRGDFEALSRSSRDRGDGVRKLVAESSNGSGH
jgi:hypothetical protein